MIEDPLWSGSIRTLPPIDPEMGLSTVKKEKVGLRRFRKGLKKRNMCYSPSRDVTVLKSDISPPPPAKEKRREKKATVKIVDVGGQVMPDDEPIAMRAKRIQRYAKLLEAAPLYSFVIWKGKRHGIDGFRKRYAIRWKAIDRIIGMLEDFCLSEAIPLAVIEGTTVDALARCDVARCKIADLLKCITSVETLDDDVVKPPKKRKSRIFSERRAVTTIAALIRGVLARRWVTAKRTFDGAALRLQLFVRKSLASRKIFFLIQQRRHDRDRRWASLVDHLKENAASLGPGMDRVEIHLPSLGFAEQMRLGDDFLTTQALQIARLCAARDPSVHVVYVSPMPLADDIIDYYRKIVLNYASAESSVTESSVQQKTQEASMGYLLSQQQQEQQQQERKKDDDVRTNAALTIVSPEFAAEGNEHLTLASLVVYSPLCRRRLKKIAKAAPFAVIVPAGPVGWAERVLSVELGIPLLGPDPEKAALLGSKSGGKRLFEEAAVNVPLGATDIYDSSDLIRALAKLIAAHLDVRRWIISLDGDVAGVAYFDVDGVPIIEDLRKERTILRNMHQKKDPWLTADAQDLATTKLTKDLPGILAAGIHISHFGAARRLNDDAWTGFQALLRRFGAVIEAEPLEVTGRALVHIFIRPDGVFHRPIVQEALLDDDYHRVAVLYPPVVHAMRPDALTAAAESLSNVLLRHGAIGYATISFVAYKTPDDDLRVSATEIEFGLTTFAVGHLLHHTVSSRDDDGAYCYIPCIRHAGLTNIKLGDLFKLTRLHDVHFDYDRCRGPLVVLVDSLTAGVIGGLMEGPQRPDALVAAMRLCTFLRKFVNTAHVIFYEPPQTRGLGVQDLIPILSAKLDAESSDPVDREKRKAATILPHR